MSPVLPLDTSILAPLNVPQVGFSEQQQKSFLEVSTAQTEHRISLVKSWKNDFEGQTVLEVGCGQGDMSVVLAAAVSSDGVKKGKVVAWDPAVGDYGSPMTLAQAQANLVSRTELSPYLSFSLTTELSSLLSPASSTSYDSALLAHCIYYFPSPTILLETFRALHSHTPPIKNLLLAEHSLQTSTQEQIPHLLAILAQSALESLRTGGADHGANVRTVLSPKKIAEIALEAGWVLEKETFITPHPDLQDGGWEVGTVCSKDWFDDVEQTLGFGSEKERERAWIEAMRDGTVAAKAKVVAEGKKVQTVDTWVASFSRK